jgi:uncharacterized protein
MSLLFWAGQITLGLSYINRYTLYIRNAILRNFLTALILIIIFPAIPLFFLFFHDLSFVKNALFLSPSNFFDYMVLLYLFYGLLFLFKSVYSRIKNSMMPFPEKIRIISQNTLHPEKKINLIPPSIHPLFNLFLHKLNDYYKIEINTYEIECYGLPQEFDGIRIGHISDLHFDGKLDPGYYKFCMDELHKLKPDIILVTGDLISRRIYIPEISEILTNLQAKEGVYIIRGNHDFWKKNNHLERDLIIKGCNLLNNRSIMVKRDKSMIRITGVEHPWNRMKNWNKKLFRDKDNFTICITHTPDNFRRAADAGADLIFCGHTHGGQVRLPYIGSIICPSRFSYNFKQAFKQKNNSLLFVNRGIGSTFPFRFNCPPEITLHVLRKEMLYNK